MPKVSYYIDGELVSEERVEFSRAHRKVRYICESLELPVYYVYRESEEDGYKDIILFKSDDGYVVRHHNDVKFRDYDQAISLLFDLTVIGYPLFMECGTEVFKIVIDYDEWP